MGQTDWLPGILTLAVAALVGGIVAWRASRRAAARDFDDLDQRDLEAERDAVIAQLRDLEVGTPQSDPAELAQERYALELRAAEVLRALDRGEQSAAASKSAPAPSAKAEPEAPSGGSALKGALIGGGTVAFFAVLFITLTQDAQQRGEGQSMTGNTALGGTKTAAGVSSPAIDALRQRVAQNPQDLEAKLDLAAELLRADAFIEVFQLSQEVLEANPKHPRALTYQAMVRVAMGQGDQALEMLDLALEVDPVNVEAWAYRGFAALRLGRFELAVSSLRKAQQLRPDGAEALDPLIQKAQAMAAGGGADAPASQPAAATGDASGRIRGTLTLAPGQAPPASGVIFLALRRAGVRGGPPAAAIKLPPGPFPLHFDIGPEHAMLSPGGALPPRCALDARVDTDGNAMTREAGAPAGRIDEVALGSEGIQLVLGGGAAPASQPAAAPASQPAPQGQGISGQLLLAEGQSAPPANAVIFLTVRPAGSRGGPPSAALRLPAGAFPLAFAIGPQHSMVGLPFPASAVIEARVDTDGNAMTREPGAPTARQDGIAAGTRDLSLTLR